MTDKPEVFEIKATKEMMSALCKGCITSVEVLPDGIYLHVLDFSDTDVTFSIGKEKETEE